LKVNEAMRARAVDHADTPSTAAFKAGIAMMEAGLEPFGGDREKYKAAILTKFMELFESGKYYDEEHSLSQVIGETIIWVGKETAEHEEDLIELYQRASVNERHVVDFFFEALCGVSIPGFLLALLQGRKYATQAHAELRYQFWDGSVFGTTPKQAAARADYAAADALSLAWCREKHDRKMKQARGE
jgi:hypothetical protein